MAFRAFTFYLGMHFPPFIVWSFDFIFYVLPGAQNTPMVVGILNALTTEALGTRYIQRHKKKAFMVWRAYT